MKKTIKFINIVDLINTAAVIAIAIGIGIATTGNAHAGMLWDSSYEDCRNSRIKVNSTLAHAATVTAYCRDKFVSLDAPGTGGRHVYRQLNGRLEPLKLSEYRKLYPEYTDLSDQELMDGMYNKYFRHLSYSDYYKALELTKTK